MPSTKGLARKKFKDRGTPNSRKRKSAVGAAADEREVRSPLAKQSRMSGGGNVRMLKGIEWEDVEEIESSEADVGVVSDSNIPLDTVEAVVDEVGKGTSGSRTVLSPPRFRRQGERVGVRSQSVPRVSRDSEVPPSAVSAEAGMTEGEGESASASTPVTRSRRDRDSAAGSAWEEGLAKLAELKRLGCGRDRLTQALRELEALAGEAESEDEEVAIEVAKPVTPVKRTAAPGVLAEYYKQYGDRFAWACQTSLTDSMTAPDMAAWLVAAKHAVRYAESCYPLPEGIPAVNSYTLVSKRIVGKVCRYAISVSEMERHRDTAAYLDALVQGLISKNCRNVTLRVDAIGRLAACRQGEREPLLEYLDRYRAVVEIVLASAYARWSEAERQRWGEDIMLELQQGLLHPSLSQRLSRARLWDEKFEDFESYWQYLCHYLIDHERRGTGTGSLRYMMAAPEGVPVSLGVAAEQPAPPPRAPIVHESRVHQVAQGTVTAVTPRVPMSEIVCYRCEQRGHIMANCPTIRMQTSSRGKTRTCFGCGKPGHVLRDCRFARGHGSKKDVGRKKYKREETRVEALGSTRPTGPEGINTNARVNAVQGAGSNTATVDGILSSLYSASANGAALASGARIFMVRGAAAGGGGSGGGGKRPRSDKKAPKGSSTTPRRKIKKAKGAALPPAAAEAEKVVTKREATAIEVAKPASPRATAAAPAVSPVRTRSYAATVAASAAVPVRAPAAAPSSPLQGKVVARLSGPRHRGVVVTSWEFAEKAGVGWMDQLGERLFEQVRAVSALLSAALLVLGRQRGRGHTTIKGWWDTAIERLKYVAERPEGPFATAQQREGLLEEGEQGLAEMLECPLEGYGNTLRGVGANIEGRITVQKSRDELVGKLTSRGPLSAKGEQILVCMCLRAVELYWLLSARTVMLRHLVRDCIGFERKLPDQIRVESRAALYQVLISASPAAYLEGFAKALPTVLSRLTPDDAVSNALLRVEAWSGKAMVGRSPSTFGFTEVEASSHGQLFVRKDKPERMGCPKGLAGVTVVLSGAEVDNSSLTQEDTGRRDRAIKACSGASGLVRALASFPVPVPAGYSLSSSGAIVPTTVVSVPTPVEAEKTEEGVPSPSPKAIEVAKETPSEEGPLTAESADELVKQAASVMLEAVKQLGECVSRGTARGRGVELRMSLSDMWVILLEALDLYGTMVAERTKAVEEHGKTRVSRTSPTGATRFGAGLAVRARKRKQVTLWLEACDALSDAIAEAVKALRVVYSGPIEVRSEEVLELAACGEVGKEVLAVWEDILARVGGGALSGALEVGVLSPPRRISEEIQAVPVTPPVDTPALEQVLEGTETTPKELEKEPSMTPIEVGGVLAPPSSRPKSPRTPVDPPVGVTTNTTPSRYEGRGVGVMGDERVSSACRRHIRLGCCESPSTEGDCYLYCVPGLITLGSGMDSRRTLGERTAEWDMLVGADALVDGSTCGDHSDNGALISQEADLRVRDHAGRTQGNRSPAVSCSCVCVGRGVVRVWSTHALMSCCGANKEVTLCIRTLRWGYGVLGALSRILCHRIVLVFCVAPERVVVSIPQGRHIIDTVKQRTIKYNLDTCTWASCCCGDSWYREAAGSPEERLDWGVHPLRVTNTDGAMALYKSDHKCRAERSGSHGALKNCVGGRHGRYIKTAPMRVATSEFRCVPLCHIDGRAGCVSRHVISVKSVFRCMPPCNIEGRGGYVSRHGVERSTGCVLRHDIADATAATLGSVVCEARGIMCCHDSHLCTKPEATADGDEVGYRLVGQHMGAGADCREYSEEIRKTVPNTPRRDEAKPRAVVLNARVAQMRVANRRVPEGQAETHPLLVALLRRGGLSMGVAGVAAGNPASPYVTVRVEERDDLQLRALLDSGATHSCISKKALESIAHAVGAEKVNRWPKAPTPMTVSMANGAQVRPCGAIVLRLGLLTLRHTVVWSDMAFLIFEGMSEDVILGMDWEERMGVTRLQPARMLGLSVTEQSRATYLNWGADTLSQGAMVRDIPAEVFNHLIPFAMGGEIAGSQRSLLPQTVECKETSTSSVAALQPLQMLGAEQQPLEGSCEGNQRQSKPTTGSRSLRAALRSVRHFAIPPRTEVGPIEVEVRCPTASQPL